MIEKLIEQQETIKGMQENEESAIKIMKMYEDYKLRVDKAIEYNKQKIEDIRTFYRPTEDTIYSGDTIIDIAKINIEILKGE